MGIKGTVHEKVVVEHEMDVYKVKCAIHKQATFCSLPRLQKSRVDLIYLKCHEKLENEGVGVGVVTRAQGLGQLCV